MNENGTENIEQKLNEIIATEAPPPAAKRGRGRPVGYRKPTPHRSAPPVTLAEPDTTEPDAPPVNIPIAPVMDILIQRMPNPIKLSSSEADILNNTFNAVMNKYITSFKYGEEISLAACLIGILYPRMKKDKPEIINEPQPS